MSDGDLIRQLSVRLAAASEVLSVLAAKDGRVQEIMRMRAVLERIVDDPWRAVDIAKEGLRI